MSQFPSPIPNGASYLGVPAYGGYGFSQWVTQPVLDQPSKAKPDLGISEQTALRIASGSIGPWGPYGMGLTGPGGWGMQWTGARFIPPIRGWYVTYRMMDFHPTAVKCKSKYQSKIAGNPLVFEANETKGGTQKDVDFAKAVFTDTIQFFLKLNCVESLTFGHQAFEEVWGMDGGQYFFERLDPLPPDGLQVCRYREGKARGQFAGVIPYGQGLPGRLDEKKSWVCAIESKCLNPYGTSYHEYYFDDWIADNMVMFDEWKLRLKVSNVIPIMMYPQGESQITMQDGTIKKEDNFFVAQRMIQNLQETQGVILPLVKYEPKDVKEDPNLAKVGLWHIDWYDAGTLAPAIQGYISSHDHHDKRIVRGWRLSDSILEGSAGRGMGGGGAGKAQESGDDDDAQIEFVDLWFAMQIQSLIDTLMTVNRRPKGCVTVKSKPFFDAEEQAAQTLMGQAIASPVFGPDLEQTLDIDFFIQKAGYRSLPGTSWAKVMKQKQDQAAQQQDNQQELHTAKVQHLKQPMNGKPMNGRMAGIT